MQIFRKSLAKKKQVIVVLALLLPTLITSSIRVSDSSIPCELYFSIPPVTSESTNYTLGVSPNEEYTWIITAVREKNLELVFGSNWTDVFGLYGAKQGYKFRVKVTSVQSNGTHSLLEFDAWDCLYRLTNFSVTPDCSCRYDYPIYPQNYTDTFELVSLFPLFLPTPLVSFVFDSNLSASYYDAMNNTYYGGGLNVYYNRPIYIEDYDITISSIAEYHENGALDYFRIYYINGSEHVEILSVEAFKPHHLKQTSMGHQVGEEFTWILVNYNLSLIDSFFGEAFFDAYGLLPNPERMQSIKMKVDAVSENDTSWRVDYSLYDWTSLEHSFPESVSRNSSYEFKKDPFNESRLNCFQIPYLIPEPTEFYLQYGKFGDNFQFLYDFNSYLFFHFGEGDEWFYGRIYYNTAGVLTSMIFTRRFYGGGQTIEQVAFEIALYYDTATPDYVGIEEGAEFNYDIYTNESIEPNMAFPTKNFDNSKIEIIKIFGEEIASGRTMVIANFSLKKNGGAWEIADLFLVGYVHSDSSMYFDPLVPTNVNPLFLAPLFVNNRMNWSEFAFSYSNYSGLQSLLYYSVSEMENGYKFHYQDFVKNVTFSYTYNETGFLSEYTIYVNNVLHHNCTLDEIIDPPIILDTDPPVITLTNPSSEKLFGVSPPVFNLTVEEEQLNCTWFSLSNESIEFMQELSFASGESIVEISGQINQTFWNCFSDGNLTVRFYANDSSGNLNWKEITVTKDATAPTISILNIMGNEEFNDTAPEFELAIAEIHLNSTWYTVNGSEIVYFTGNSCLIDQVIWESLPNGSALVQFFALDDLGNIGTAQVIVIKSITPEISPPPVEPGEPANTLTFTLVSLSLGMVGVATIALFASRKRK